MISHPSSPQAFQDAVRGRVLLVGAGKMGGAMLQGWLDCGLAPDRVTITDPHASVASLRAFADRGVSINPPPSDMSVPATLVLAIKPQGLAAAAPGLAALADAGTMLLSIVAGKTCANLADAFPAAGAIVRAMPNTPAAIGRGITGVFARADLSEDQRREIDALLGAVGFTVWLENEADIDAVTAVSGSGPAYVFFLTECLTEAAERLGLAPEIADRLARATVEGAAALMTSQAGTPPSTLRENVTSPGGTTAAALSVLMKDDRMLATMTEAVAAARRRAAELAG